MSKNTEIHADVGARDHRQHIAVAPIITGTLDLFVNPGNVSKLSSTLPSISRTLDLVANPGSVASNHSSKLPSVSWILDLVASSRKYF